MFLADSNVCRCLVDYFKRRILVCVFYCYDCHTGFFRYLMKKLVAITCYTMKGRGETSYCDAEEDE